MNSNQIVIETKYKVGHTGWMIYGNKIVEVEVYEIFVGQFVVSEQELPMHEIWYGVSNNKVDGIVNLGRMKEGEINLFNTKQELLNSL